MVWNFNRTKTALVHSIFRAIESGKYVIRSANNGMTVIINPLERLKKIEYEKDGFIDFTERRDLEPTIFSIYGNKIFIILILLYIFLIFSFNRIKMSNLKNFLLLVSRFRGTS